MRDALHRWVVVGFLGLLVSESAWAAVEKITYAVPAALTYRDTRWDCEAKTMVGNEVYLVVEAEDGRARSAKLRIGSATAPSREFVFTDEELAPLRLERDADGKAWLSELVLSERLTREAFYFWTYLACGAPRVRTVDSAPLNFSFDVDTPKPWTKLKSNERTFRGTGGSGRAYTATLMLGQGPLASTARSH